MKFGHALEAARQGKKITREKWVSYTTKDIMFAYVVPAAEYPSTTDLERDTYGDWIPYETYWALFDPDVEMVSTWSPSGRDILAEDWIILDY